MIQSNCISHSNLIIDLSGSISPEVFYIGFLLINLRNGIPYKNSHDCVKIRTCKPGYFNSDYEFFVEWEAQHLLKWDKVDDEPMNLTVRFGRYTLEKGACYLPYSL